MADGWVGGLVAVAQLGASLLAQKKAQEEARKRAQTDFNTQSGRGGEDLGLAITRAREDMDRAQPQARQQAAADIGFQRAAALGAPGVGYRARASKLLSGQEFDSDSLDIRSERAREDLARRGGRGQADLSNQMNRYSQDHATDYLDPILKSLGSLRLNDSSGGGAIDNLRAPSEGAFQLQGGVRDPDYTFKPGAATGGDPGNFQLGTPQLLQDQERDPYLNYRKFRL